MIRDKKKIYKCYKIGHMCAIYIVRTIMRNDVICCSVVVTVLIRKEEIIKNSLQLSAF